MLLISVASLTLISNAYLTFSRPTGDLNLELTLGRPNHEDLSPGKQSSSSSSRRDQASYHYSPTKKPRLAISPGIDVRRHQTTPPHQSMYVTHNGFPNFTHKEVRDKATPPVSHNELPLSHLISTLGTSSMNSQRQANTHQAPQRPPPKFNQIKWNRKLWFTPDHILKGQTAEIDGSHFKDGIWLPDYKKAKLPRGRRRQKEPVQSLSIEDSQSDNLSNRNQKKRELIRSWIISKHPHLNDDGLQQALLDILQQGSKENLYFHSPGEMKHYVNEHPEVLKELYYSGADEDKWRAIIDKYKPSN